MKNKGSQTKEFILIKGLHFVSTNGFTDITIGKLATICKISRSGLFAHFKSREQLQLDILDYAEKIFIDTVIAPVKDIDNPLEKIQNLCRLWPNWLKKYALDLDVGCVFMSASFEYSNRESEIGNYLLSFQKKLLDYLEKIFQDGQNKSLFTKDISSNQMAYDFYSKYLGYNMYNHFLRDTNAHKYLEHSLLSFFDSIKVHSS